MGRTDSARNKTVEFRLQITKIRGHVYIYAALGKPDGSIDDDFAVTDSGIGIVQ